MTTTKYNWTGEHAVKIATNTFVKRQIAASQFSHFEGSWKALETLVTVAFNKAKPGYRKGVKLVPVPADGFFSALVAVKPDMALQATCTPRCEGEEPFINVTVDATEKQPARAVDIVIYSHETLGDDASTDAEWEIISINARCYANIPEQMTPMAMARNFLELSGGTKATYTAEEFALAIVFWSQHAMVSGT